MTRPAAVAPSRVCRVAFLGRVEGGSERFPRASRGPVKGFHKPLSGVFQGLLEGAAVASGLFRAR